MLSVAEMKRLGLQKLLGHLCCTREDLADIMVAYGVIELGALAEFLAEQGTIVCPQCANNYASVEYLGMCEECYDVIRSSNSWRD